MNEEWTLEPDSRMRGASPDKAESSLAEYCLSEPSSAMMLHAEMKLTPGNVHMRSISPRISGSCMAQLDISKDASQCCLHPQEAATNQNEA